MALTNEYKVTPEPGKKLSSFMKSFFKMHFLLCLITLLSLLISIRFFKTIQGYWEDPYIYLELAENLQSFKYESYRFPHYKYFPGYPISIAVTHLALGKLFPYDFAAKLVSVLGRCLVLPLVYFTSCRIGLSRTSGLFAVLFLILNPFAMELGVHVYSESLFSMFMILGLYHTLGSNNSLAGLSSACATWVRPEGIFLVLSRVTWNRKPRELFQYVLAYCLMIVPLAYRQISFWWKQTGGYVGEMAVSRHAGYRFLGTIPLVTGWFFLLMLVIGLLNRNLKSKWILHVFVLCFIGLHCYWWWNDERFVVSILPILAIYVGQGITSVCRYFSSLKIKQNIKKLVYVTWILILLSVLTGRFVVLSTALLLEEKTRSSLFISTVKTLDNTMVEPGAIISADPGLVRYHSKRISIASWDYQSMDTTVFLFHAYYNVNARYLIIPGYYVFDLRFNHIIQKYPEGFTYLVTPPETKKEKIRFYRLTINLFMERYGTRLYFINNPTWWLKHPVLIPGKINIRVYKLDLKEISIKPGTPVEAIPVKINPDIFSGLR